MEIIADYHFNIKTWEPYPALEALLSKSGGDILPKNYIEEVGMDGFLKGSCGIRRLSFCQLHQGPGSCDGTQS